MRSPVESVKPRRGCRLCDGTLIGREMGEGYKLEESRTGWLNDVAFIFVNVGKVFFFFPLLSGEDSFPSPLWSPMGVNEGRK